MARGMVNVSGIYIWKLIYKVEIFWKELESDWILPMWCHTEKYHNGVTAYDGLDLQQ